MLIASELKTQMIQAFNDPENSEQAHARIAGAIKNYVLANASIQGTYNGLMPNGSPDPLNNLYTWRFASMDDMNKDTLLADVGDETHGALNKWTTNIKSALASLTLNTGDAGTTPQVNLTTPISATIGILNFGDMSTINDFNNAMQRIAEKIIDSLKSATILTAGATTAQGTGQVVFGGIT